ncbi:DNA sulfur modification protein DndB [Couchioplanes azureus]|uniref:DNA sulfur modification protein DndB n=1 Tax=Couchioplanes caeruleus TaxID=56438 RepID=UPI00167018B0|nr:DNA sulfur modification protein DndB [Couchioplanes caeruleus]GGQ44697.1 hypothetical protein GCM10010166_11560 [Couchioplanes caeruleus subsp. azureus]
MTTAIEELDLSMGSYVKGITLDDHTFLATTNFRQVKTITRDPVLLQPNARRGVADVDELEHEQSIHELIQRALSSGKKANVPKYRAYIERLVQGNIGVLPPMHLWSGDLMKVINTGGNTYIVVPNGERLLAIDGETQLTAHYALGNAAAVPAEVKEKHRRLPLAAVIHHGIDIRAARQYFYDLNVLAVRPNTSLSLSMDARDPIMQVVGDVESGIPFLHGRVDRQARQLTKKSAKVVTLQALRQMVINVAKGKSGIQYGARPAPLEDVDMPELTTVAGEWIGAFFNTFEREITNREEFLAATGPVLAAVGAMGHDLLKTPDYTRGQRMTTMLESLRAVDWAKGNHWDGIAGGYTLTGAFSVKGTKEVAYAVYNALTNVESGAYHRVRRSTASISPAPVSASATA